MHIIKSILLSAIVLSATLCSAQNAHLKSVRHEVTSSHRQKKDKVKRDIPLANRDFTHFDAGMAIMTMPNLMDDFSSGLHFGVTRACNLARGKSPFFFQFGIEYNVVFNTIQTDGEVRSEKLGNVALPVSLLYRSELPRDVFMDVSFGPNFRFNSVGECKANGKCIDYFEDLCARGYQFGLNVGLSFKFPRFSVNYRFNPDLSDYYDAEELHREDSRYDPKAQSKTHYHFLSLGYTF